MIKLPSKLHLCHLGDALPCPAADKLLAAGPGEGSKQASSRHPAPRSAGGHRKALALGQPAAWHAPQAGESGHHQTLPWGISAASGCLPGPRRLRRSCASESLFMSLSPAASPPLNIPFLPDQIFPPHGFAERCHKHIPEARLLSKAVALLLRACAPSSAALTGPGVTVPAPLAQPGETLTGCKAACGDPTSPGPLPPAPRADPRLLLSTDESWADGPGCPSPPSVGKYPLRSTWGCSHASLYPGAKATRRKGPGDALVLAVTLQ